MPLTPQEQQELAQLEAEVGLSPEEEAELAQLEAQEQAQYQAPIGPGVGPVQSWADAGERAKTIVGLGDKQALWPEGSNPEKYPVKGTPPLVGPNVGALARASQLANANFATRIGANTGAAGLEALLKGHPEDAGDQMRTAGVISAGLEGAGGLAKLAGMGMKGIGKAFTRVTREQADDYARNAGLADELHGLEKNHPDQLAERALGESKEALQKLQSQSTDPAIAELNLRMAPKNFQVKPEQFQGTAAGSEIERAAALTPPTQGQESAQSAFAKLSGLLKPAEQESQPLTGAQLLRAKRASGEAMNANRAKNPMGYRASDDTEAKAMSALRKAMRSADPKSAALDRTVEKNLRISNEVRNMGNPARIYSGGDSLGSVPVRQAQQYLDKMTGSNFTQAGKALEAGRAVHQPGTGIIDDLAVKPLGRSLLRGSSKAKSAGDALHNALLIQWLADKSEKEE